MRAARAAGLSKPIWVVSFPNSPAMLHLLAVLCAAGRTPYLWHEDVEGEKKPAFHAYFGESAEAIALNVLRDVADKQNVVKSEAGAISALLPAYAGDTPQPAARLVWEAVADALRAAGLTADAFRVLRVLRPCVGLALTRWWLAPAPRTSGSGAWGRERAGGGWTGGRRGPDGAEGGSTWGVAWQLTWADESTRLRRALGRRYASTCWRGRGRRRKGEIWVVYVLFVISRYLRWRGGNWRTRDVVDACGRARQAERAAVGGGRLAMAVAGAARRMAVRWRGGWEHSGRVMACCTSRRGVLVLAGVGRLGMHARWDVFSAEEEYLLQQRKLLSSEPAGGRRSATTTGVAEARGCALAHRATMARAKQSGGMRARRTSRRGVGLSRVARAVYAPPWELASARLLLDAVAHHRMHSGRSGNRLPAGMLEKAVKMGQPCRVPSDSLLASSDSTAVDGILLVLNAHAESIGKLGVQYGHNGKTLTTTAEKIVESARGAAARSQGTRATSSQRASTSRDAPARAPRRARETALPPWREDQRDCAELADAIARVEATLPRHGTSRKMEQVTLEASRPCRVQSLGNILEAQHPWDACAQSWSVRAARLQEWRIDRAMVGGTSYVLQFRRLEEEITCSGLDEHGLPALGVVAKHLHRDQLPCAVGSSSNHYWLVRVRVGVLEWRPMAVSEVASTLGVPAGHCLRTGLRTVHEGIAIGLCGNGVHVQSGGRVLELAVAGTHTAGQITAGFAGAGAGFIGAAADAAFGREGWSHSFFAECDDTHAEAHLAAWRARGRAQRFVRADDASQILGMPYVKLWQYSPRCQPFTTDNRTPATDVDEALAETRAALRYVRYRRPDVIVLEQTAGILRGTVRGVAGVLERLEGMLHEVPCYRWRRVVECPSEHAGALARRRRVWFVGVREA